MSETPFIITIDTEGDDLWGRSREITTRNAEYLPRFQSLCERFRFKPVYLTNYEMAMSDVFVEFARDVVARGACEIGMHLHAWNSPPLEPLTSDDFRFHPYLIEYPEPVMKEKIRTLTRLLEDRLDRAMISHRAGRWAFDGRYAAMLLDGGHGAVDAISLVEQHGSITTVESPAPGTMADHRPIKPVFEEARERPDLLLHHRLGVFDQVGVKTEVVAGQRLERRRVPRMQMHPDLAGAAGNHIARELDKNVGHRHLIGRKVNRLETEPLAERLETRQVLRVAGGNFPRSPPEIITLGVNRDYERRLRHGVRCATRSGRHACPLNGSSRCIQASGPADC